MEILEKPHSGEIYDPVPNNVQEIQARGVELAGPSERMLLLRRGAL